MPQPSTRAHSPSDAERSRHAAIVTGAHVPAARTPVIVGVGFHQEKLDDPTLSSEPYALMVEAARRAAADAGSPALLPAIESITVPQGMWEYRNPAKLVAEALGCPRATTALT